MLRSVIHAGGMHLVSDILAVVVIVVEVGLLVGGPGGEGRGHEADESSHQGQREAGPQRHLLARVLNQFSVLAHDD